MSDLVAIVDYGMGNIRSLHNMLSFTGADVIVTGKPDEIATAQRLILPGVGAFGDAMDNLRSRGLVEPLRQAVFEQRKPFLGICLGLQLLADESSEHGAHQGLGWIPGKVSRFEVTGLKVPHVGWNRVEPTREHPMFEGLNTKAMDFYFVHSFHFDCADPAHVAATTSYGGDFVSALSHDNIFAVQFHPEKSQDNGVQMIQNFLGWKP